MKTTHQQVLEALELAVRFGYDPGYTWESACDHAANWFVLTLEEFTESKFRIRESLRKEGNRKSSPRRSSRRAA